jgi:iron(III) transport system permease protein
VAAHLWSATLGKLPGSLLVWVVLGVLIVIPVGAFLLLAFSPRLFSQGSAWFTLANFRAVFTGQTLHGFVDSIWVSATTAAVALGLATCVAWLVHRTDIFGRRVWPLAMWALLLMPTYLMANGWEYLLQPDGVLQRLGIPSSFAYHLIFGPFGVVLVLTMAGLPFAYLVMSAALAGLGQEFEDAARVHGAGRSSTLRAVLPIVLPSMLSAVAIVFAESMSDFGVSSTLAYQSHFPMATYGLFNAIDINPANFGVAAALGWLLVASAAIPIAIQSRALRGRSYAVLSGRTRTPTRHRLRPGARAGLTTAVAGLFVVALGVPLFGAVVASLLSSFGQGNISVHALTLSSYRAALASSQFLGPMLLSNRLAAITASITVVVGLLMARMLTSRRRGRANKVADLMLLGSMALPGIVLAAGYIFAFNLPIASRLGVDLYETLPLLVMGYIATVLPSQSRLMVGPVSQVQDSMMEAARVHGGGLVRSWRRTYVPVLSRTLLWAWLFSFAKILLELPVSQILYPPGQEPISVGIENLLGDYHYDVGTAMTVMAVGEMFAVIGVVLLAFRLLAPRGWQRIGGAVRGY